MEKRDVLLLLKNSRRKSERSMMIPTKTMEHLKSQGNCEKPAKKVAVKTVANYMRQMGSYQIPYL